MDKDKITHSSMIVKGIDYMTEEYVKQLLTYPDTKLSAIKPFVGVIKYPSADFLKNGTIFQQTVQFQNSTYIGYMDCLFPTETTNNNLKVGYTLLEFNLDGQIRQFVQISKPDVLNGNGVKFKDFIADKFPKANDLIAFNRAAIHVLTDIKLSGAEYQLSATNAFEPIVSGTGAFTPSIEFEFAISGYKAIIE